MTNGCEGLMRCLHANAAEVIWSVLLYNSKDSERTSNSKFRIISPGPEEARLRLRSARGPACAVPSRRRRPTARGVRSGAEHRGHLTMRAK